MCFENGRETVVCYDDCVVVANNIVGTLSLCIEKSRDTNVAYIR